MSLPTQVQASAHVVSVSPLNNLKQSVDNLSPVTIPFLFVQAIKEVYSLQGKCSKAHLRRVAVEILQESPFHGPAITLFQEQKVEHDL